MKTLADIRRYFAHNTTPIYYLNMTAFNLLGAEEWIGGLRFINTIDSFDGQHARVFVPPGATRRYPNSMEEINQYVLTDSSAKQWAVVGGKVLFLISDAENEAAAQRLGLDICLPPAALREHLDSKIVTTELAAQAGIASVPNVLAKVESYADLRRAAAALGQDLVVQLPYGDMGHTTFFIADERDFQRYAPHIIRQPIVKIMRRIRCCPLTIEGCVTRHGTLVGPLQTELVGHPELTPYSGGWCGNEIFGANASPIITSDLRQKAQQLTQVLGQALQRMGYRGCFGLDLLLDQDTGALYLGEMNPRITGATPMTNQVMLEADSAPLLLFHLLEWFGAEYEVDVAAYNEQWCQANEINPWSQLIVTQLEEANENEVICAAPPSGIWQMQPDGTAQFIRPAFSLREVRQENEVLFLRTVNLGRDRYKGGGLGRIVRRGRALTDDFQLQAQTQAWIRHFCAQFQWAKRGVAA